MKKLKVMVAVAAATMMMSAAIGQDAAADLRAEISIPGESLDSGLGQLSSTYTAAEYNTQGWVRGESLDSGLGELDQTYTGAEYMPASAELVSSEDLANWRCSTCS
jgi:hypothetical protein